MCRACLGIKSADRARAQRALYAASGRFGKAGANMFLRSGSAVTIDADYHSH